MDTSVAKCVCVCMCMEWNIAMRHIPLTRLSYVNATATNLKNFKFRLALIGLKILGKPVHHSVDYLIHSVLLDDPTLLSTPFLVIVPGKPTHGVIPVALEDVPTVQGPIVVHQQNVAGFH
jgi:hypothetical protein